MTWVIGSGVRWGYGALIADTRVSWPDGTRHDVLQKCHEVAPGLIAGFAGSVEMGFLLIDDMRGFFMQQPAAAFNPSAAATAWRRRARRIFGAPGHHHRLGCQLLLAGVAPSKEDSLADARVFKMSAPAFMPQAAPPFCWLSIGQGASAATARHFAEQQMQGFAEGVGRVEATGKNQRGGVAEAVAYHVYQGLKEHPIASVSDRLLIALAFPDRPEFREPFYVFYGSRENPIEPIEPQRPAPLIASWEDYKAFAKGNGLQASAGCGCSVTTASGSLEGSVGRHLSNGQ